MLSDVSGRECCLETAVASVAEAEGMAVLWLVESEAGLSEGPVACDKGEGRDRGGLLLCLPLGLLSFGLQHIVNYMVKPAICLKLHAPAQSLVLDK